MYQTKELFLKNKTLILCVLVFGINVCTCMVCMPSACRGQKNSRSTGTGITSDHEPTCGCWGSNPGPPKEQPVLLTAEPSLQPYKKAVWELEMAHVVKCSQCKLKNLSLVLKLTHKGGHSNKLITSVTEAG